MGEHEQAIGVLDDLLRVERTNEQAAINREVLTRALAEMRERRLLGKTEKEIERCALVQEGQLKRRGQVPTSAADPRDVVSVVRYGTASPKCWWASRTGDHQPAHAGPRRSGKGCQEARQVFRVTVVGTSGRREPAN